MNWDEYLPFIDWIRELTGFPYWLCFFLLFIPGLYSIRLIIRHYGIKNVRQIDEILFIFIIGAIWIFRAIFIGIYFLVFINDFWPLSLSLVAIAPIIISSILDYWSIKKRYYRKKYLSMSTFLGILYPCLFLFFVFYATNSIGLLEISFTLALISLNTPSITFIIWFLIRLWKKYEV